MGNEFMVAISLECQAELYARLCKPKEAKRAYRSAHALLENIEGRERTDTHCRLEIRKIRDMCEFEIGHDVIFFFISLFLAYVILCLLHIHRRWGGRGGL
jgi:hypothetical protein